MAETKSKEKMVKIILPIIKGNNGAVYVRVNHYTCRIPRGVEVEVPEYVAKELRRSENAVVAAEAYEMSVQK